MIVFFLVKDWEESARFNGFKYKATDHAAAIQTEFEHVEKIVSHVRLQIDHDINVDHNHLLKPKIFMPMAEKFVIDDPALLSIAWAIEIKNNAGNGGFGSLKLLYVQHGANALDDDLTAGMDYSDHTSLSLLHERKKKLTAFVHQDANNSTSGEGVDHEMNFIALVRSQQQVGALITEFSLDRLMERAVSKLPVSAQDIRLYSMAGDTSWKLVHTHMSRSRTAADKAVHTGISYQVPFEFSGLRWQLEFEAAPKFFRQHPIVLAWQSLVICLLLTLLITWSVRNTRRQTAIIEAQVQERTDALARSQSLLHAVLDHSPAVITIKDADGSYLLANHKFEQLFDMANEAIIGKTDAEIFDAEVATELSRNDQQVMRDGEAVLLEERVSDGRSDRFYSSLKFPLTDLDGQSYAVCSMATDITDQKLAEADKAKLATVVEQADEMVVITDQQGVIEYVNPSFTRVSGYSADEVIGQTPAMLKSGQHPDSFYMSMWNALKSGKTWRHDFINRNKQGDFYTVDQAITPILDDKGNITAFASVQRDVTRSRELELHLQHSERVESLGVLAGGIAHDFNNLLAAILGNTSLAKRKLPATSPAMHHLEAIDSASNSAAELCRQMLAYSGKGKFVVKTINLSMMVEDMGKLIDVSLAKNVVVKYHLNEQLPAIDADVAQMQQIVLNLITNASEAIGGKSGVISLSTGMMQVDADYLEGCVAGEHVEPGRYVCLEVSDTGCGMDEATREKMFDPFFTTKFTGRGLGMSAMLGIVKGHHGAMRVYSEVGRGTTMKVAFPVSRQALEGIRQAVEHKLDFSCGGTVLVIDDEESIREMAAAMLETFDCDVLTAIDGLDGVEVFEQHKDEISLVLMDMTMPKMDGIACFKALKSIDPNVRVILSSGYSEEDVTGRFMGKGLAGFIQKPYGADALAEVIQQAMEE